MFARNDDATSRLKQLMLSKFHLNEAVKLIYEGADPNTTDKNGNIALHFIALRLTNNKGTSDIQKYYELLDRLVNKFQANINHRNNQGLTPYQYLLSSSYYVEDAMKFIELGARYDEKNTNNKSLLQMMVLDLTHRDDLKELEKLINLYKADNEFKAENFDAKTVAILSQFKLIKSPRFIFAEEIKIKNKLGAGYFGSVYKGRWNHKFVAIKQIQIRNDSDKESYLREKHALTVLSQLQNRSAIKMNIVSLYGWIETEDSRSLVIEYMVNGDVASLLGKNIKTSYKFEIAFDMTNAIMHLHHHHFIHRDIKLENAVINQNGDVYLCDFGLTILEEDASLQTNFSGTLPFMAPEILTTKSYSTKSDAYAFAIALVELGTEKVVFEGRAKDQIIEDIIEGNTPSLPDDFPFFFRKICETGMKKDPAERPSAVEIKQELEACRSSVKGLK